MPSPHRPYTRGHRVSVDPEEEAALQELRPVDPPKPRDKPRIPVLNANDRLTGRIKRIEIGRGFAFIRDDRDPDAPVDYFMHFSVLVGGLQAFNDLNVGDRVEFWAVGSDKGPRAVRVVRLGD